MNKRILVAPLNWGLGHATRSIPIINALIENKFTPVIASDGVALELLKKEFPDLEHIELPAYNVTYAKNRHFFKLKLLQHSPKLLKAIKAEKKEVKEIVETKNIHGIISDNRLGVYNKLVPSVFMTHQLQVLSGNTTWISTKLHLKIIKHFNECWVPDNKGFQNLSGKLGHTDTKDIAVKFIGPLSRFTKKDCAIKNDIMVLLSGPEPQRTMLEEKLLLELKFYPGTVLFVKGVVEKEQIIEKRGNMILYNFMTSDLLETSLNESKLIISRSGYTTIMDLAKLGKQAFFIPTPGQFEQEYLAERLDKQKLVPSCKQEDFTLKALEKTSSYKGLSDFEYEINYKKLFSLFKTE
ncbi:glycosyltransferase [Bizionia arctica]|uniref:Glycosyl transferase n=1 Tax=Bizionia arctica TaxID=1495645 RepID=A0A917GCY3_9FLAO|nr:glycosyltransferase [Bizionia arctica]GGG39442.1 glycosyl transferase [Bizionia arctica]